MASIFISYSNHDHDIIEPYINELSRRGHTIVYDRNLAKIGENFQNTLTEGLRQADGMLAFITENSNATPNVAAEIGRISEYLEGPDPQKFFIALVQDGVKIPYVVESLQYLPLGPQTYKDNVDKIMAVIEAFMSRKNASAVTDDATPRSDAAPRRPNRARSSKAAPPANPATKAPANTPIASDPTPGPQNSAAAPTQQPANPANPAPNTPASPPDSPNPNTPNAPDTASGNPDSNNPNNPGPGDPNNPGPDNSGASAAASTGYWLIKINDAFWSIADFQPGGDYHFNTRHHFNEYTADGPLFTNIRAGDKLAAYAYNNLNSLVAVFEVTSPLHEDPSLGEIIRMRISRIITPQIPIDAFRQLIGFSGSLSAATNEKLFPLTREEFNAITATATKPHNDYLFNRRSLTRVVTDSPASEIEDQLGFMADVESLAAVIAYREFQPPLAIGLFGNWGSGKSFFMNKLEQQIKDLSASDDATWCQNIIPVHFNSWHYSDSNLWASIITRIFDELKAHGENSREITKVTDLFSQLNSTLQLKAETESKKEMVDKEIQLLSTRKTAIDEQIVRQVENLSSLSILDIARTVFNDRIIQDDIKKMQKEFSFLRLDEFKDIEASYQELNDATNDLGKGIGLVYSMRRGKLGWALFLAFAIWLGCWLLIKKIDWFRNTFDEVKAIVIPGTIVLSQFVIFIRPGLKKIKTASERIASLKRTVQTRENEEIKKANQEREKVRAGLELAKTRQLELTQQIALLETQSQLLSKEITDIASGKKLESFITSRVTDSRYTNSLGIISWIRKDFEELDRLLRQQRQAIRELDKHPGKKMSDFFIIDRIVLYIDDLDRCEADIVVRVLEAIHLLLAFPLFVVIVGVDPRWMHNALNLKYRNFLQPGPGRSPQTALLPGTLPASTATMPVPFPNAYPPPGTPFPPPTPLPAPYPAPYPNAYPTTAAAFPPPATPPGWPAATPLAANLLEANSYDYLEKIFQVPFVLKAMDNTGKRQLIQSQFTAPATPASPPDPPPASPPGSPKAANPSTAAATPDPASGPVPTAAGQPAATPATPGATPPATQNPAPDGPAIAIPGAAPQTPASPGAPAPQIPASARPPAPTPGSPPAAAAAPGSQPAPSGSVPPPADAPSQKDAPGSSPTPTATKKELLKISPEEITFMEDIAFLIGESPRTIKRFINIYRILRTHDGFRYTQGDELEHYYAALVMLGIMTGAPEEAAGIFRQIRETADDMLFASFLATNFAACLQPFTATDRPASLAATGNIRMARFKVNFDLVCRFSFRDFS